MVLSLWVRHCVHELLPLWHLSPPVWGGKCKPGPYHTIGDGIWVHSHFWVHADKVPPEGLALELFPQGLPFWNVPNINSRVLQVTQRAERARKTSVIHLCVKQTPRPPSVQNHRINWAGRDLSGPPMPCTAPAPEAKQGFADDNNQVLAVNESVTHTHPRSAPVNMTQVMTAGSVHSLLCWMGLLLLTPGGLDPVSNDYHCCSLISWPFPNPKGTGRKEQAPLEPWALLMSHGGPIITVWHFLTISEVWAAVWLQRAAVLLTSLKQHFLNFFYNVKREVVIFVKSNCWIFSPIIFILLCISG